MRAGALEGEASKVTGPGPARIDAVDALRGFALFGVVISNVAVVWGVGTGLAPESTVDHWLGLAYAYLITNRFLSLFSLLFGLSFGLYLLNVSRDRTLGVGRYVRRLGVLFLFGILNRILFGPDILMTYAVLGVFLLLFRDASDRTLLLAAVLALATPALAQALLDGLGYQPAPPIVSRAERLSLAVDGEYLRLVQIRALMLVHWWRTLVTSDLVYLSYFLFGLFVTRRHVLADPAVQRRQLRLGLLVAAVATLAGFLAQHALRPHLGGGSLLIRHSFGVAWNLTVFAQAVVYAAGLGLLWRTGARRVLGLLVPAGRLPLTNYIGASFVSTLLVLATSSYGQLSLAAASAVGILIWCLSLWWSAAWLQRYPVGPLEWLWRRLSSGRPRRPLPSPSGA